MVLSYRRVLTMVTKKYVQVCDDRRQIWTKTKHQTLGSVMAAMIPSLVDPTPPISSVKVDSKAIFRILLFLFGEPSLRAGSREIW